jgi:cob(I)alamin adenosyltransferase
VEPHENKKIDLQKAVSAHEQAEAAVADLINVSQDPRFERMLERIQTNLRELRMDAATTAPDGR